MPDGSFTETLIGTVFDPTDVNEMRTDLFTFVETAVFNDLTIKLVAFIVELVVVKKLFFDAVGDGVGEGVGFNGTKMRSGSPGVGEGVGIGVGVGKEMAQLLV